MAIYSEVKEKFSKYEKKNIHLADSLAMLIGPKAEKKDIEKIEKYQIQQLLNFDTKDFIEIGISPISSSRIMAALSLVDILVEEKVTKVIKIKSPEDAAVPFLRISNEPREVFAAIFLNTKNRVLHYEEIFRGTLNSSIVHPRELFKIALKYNSASIVVAHNHPSSDLTPSQEDIHVTKRLSEVGKIMGIEVLDHLIVSGAKHLSLKEKGYL